jgi:hypothetical protein
MRKFFSRRVSLRLGLGAVALSLGAVALGPATAASAEAPGDLTLCSYAGPGAHVVIPLGPFAHQIGYWVPDIGCNTIHFSDVTNFPLDVYMDHQYLGSTTFIYGKGMDLVVTYNTRGELMFWA